MKQKLKRISVILLVVIAMLTLAIPVFAATNGENTAETTAAVETAQTADAAAASSAGVKAIASALAVGLAAAGGAIYALLTVSFRANQNVVGLALTIFGSGFAQFIMNTLFLQVKNGKTCLAAASVKMRECLPFASKLGAFGEIFLSHGSLCYLASALAVLASLVLRKTKIG